MFSPDYQQFDFQDGDLKAGPRMTQKLRALVDLGFFSESYGGFSDQRVLDVGCDFGFWGYLATQYEGALSYHGIDRGRVLRGEESVTDLPEVNRAIAAEHDGHGKLSFQHALLGEQWPKLPWRPSVALCMSSYHHIYAASGEHKPFWLWLWSMLEEGAVVVWEGPTSTADKVAFDSIPVALHVGYDRSHIVAAYSPWFDLVKSVPAQHEPTREMWLLRRREGYIMPVSPWRGRSTKGAGGAAPAWRHNHYRRVREVAHILGETMVPGSLNLLLDEPFRWNFHYLSGRILDVKDRAQGLESEWELTPARFYPVELYTKYVRADAWVFRFEKDINRYEDNFVEVIATQQLRSLLKERSTLLYLVPRSC